ncbi:MAG TPA: class I SAM-dependent methyltransferase [Myxococcota bacterium]|nr:class I SAM-dependent methyltransferase [Myxococcota bacterium]HRY97127.1 class I SAM-dependent methyltransferase [Myxococcota bacterium]HSA21204.1 class I SAM-dependent methyltransferase [Myxococcota bacterium]
MSTDSFWTYFFEIYEAMPRQGPGDRESTERALGMIPALTAESRLLDVGCGSGTQTLDLARACPAHIVAVDKHPAFVAQLVERAAAQGLGGRVEARVGDMGALACPDRSFDAIWSEGAIFILGFGRGLAEWRRLLAPGGHLVVSEFCWLKPDPPAELMEMFLEGCPEPADWAARRAAVAEQGYELVGDFVLPARSWWENYYAPLAGSMERFRKAHAGQPEALAVADRCQREIDLARKYEGYFGYVFFVMKRGADGDR